MRAFSFHFIGGRTALRLLVTALLLQPSASHARNLNRNVSTSQLRELSSVLSSNASVILPTSPDWANATERYMQNVQPRIKASVRPGTEDDVAKIVQFANRFNIPFYAVNRGHALTSTVGYFEGIEIDLRNLNSISISPNNETAVFGGGVYSYEAINTLWDQGFVTGTGGCTCVSVIGPALGGGHGLQQGQHGLTADQFVNLNVVLANGTAIQVNETSHPNLWWAMRGAGHNFGIVTSFESKIWPDNFKSYFVKAYQFPGSSLEALFEAVNNFQGNGSLAPPWLASFGLYTINATLSTSEPTISWSFFYDGSAEDAAPDLKPFDDLKPLSVDVANVTYNVINDYAGGGLNSSLCEGNKTHIVGTAGLQVFNVTTQRAIFDLYSKKISQHPGLGGTRVLVEGYAVQGVKMFASDASAYPLRADNILTYFDSRFDSADDPLIGFAEGWRNETVELWNAGQPQRLPTTYVNYAAGYESLESMYGYEPWRLERLRQLKSIYDPKNVFAWYNSFVLPVAGRDSEH
ncbi:hypothetical protein F4861DRAFT_533018 [Xylaria intraflava]|nr:hypothetical protein F4861DRAFT_533018 [Xylaria intraflava]